VQTIPTTATPLSEIQEIVLESSIGGKIESGHFSLHFPETQVVPWSSGSHVTAGSFYLKLVIPDVNASNGDNTGCVPWNSVFFFSSELISSKFSPHSFPIKSLKMGGC
jgi:hypothetical protein